MPRGMLKSTSLEQGKVALSHKKNVQLLGPKLVPDPIDRMNKIGVRIDYLNFPSEPLDVAVDSTVSGLSFTNLHISTYILHTS